MGLSRYFNFFSNRLRYMATVRTINHYDSLGITPKATQNEIKAAYYKLSMVYHPDKNKDEASLQKFRAITEAYEVLGNVKTRKMYDRGLYFRPRTTSPPSEKMTAEADSFHKSREVRTKPPPPGGRTPIYDFDEWAKSHYGESFRKKMESKRRAQQYEEFRQKEVNNKQIERVVFIVTSIIFMCMMFGTDKRYDSVNFGTYGTYLAPKNENSNSTDKDSKQ
ncbi:unnamed protein product [Psylliodes chrysocephalus]|uniref:J domain-containing protein n=1 Tax=Psylliodes chrysocephalus TaxID=3402493 RepID=A0A9P0CT96_9CUCU|nr:unnamed protein product [Psylliodes chrysocephala]